ncbi:unnamed protein product [Staurois parvus]|uniref:Uncharacterized protein n=1 Tax=Staurois parvus TaxID=386267 RepID=A0ABN9FIU0_9NEOB|nr:unnamed protein product [Staurois parvus]
MDSKSGSGQGWQQNNLQSGTSGKQVRPYGNSLQSYTEERERKNILYPSRGQIRG